METPGKKKLNTSDRSLTSPGSFNQYSPVTLPKSPVNSSPQHNITGFPRLARDTIADIYNTIQKWNELYKCGATITQAIVVSLQALNADRIREVDAKLKELYFVVQNMSKHIENMKLLCSQINSMSKAKDKAPLFISLRTEQIAKLLREISDRYTRELNAKIIILENIGYAKTVADTTFYAAWWTHENCISDSTRLKLEVLLVETGHRNIT